MREPVNTSATSPPCRRAPWHRRARQALGHSLRLRLVAVFLLLALGLAGTFVFGVQKAFSAGWREAARPLLTDYVDRLAAEVTADAGGTTGGTPRVARAQALVQRLPVTVRIDGPVVRWQSHPGLEAARDREWTRLLSRTTADGHTLRFGLDTRPFEHRPRLAWLTLAALLALTLAAYLVVRRLLRPLDDLRDGARRFGAGDFAQPIPVRHDHRPDELGQLAQTINTMGQDIRQMLEAQRALLLAISHELRSPLTRARLHVELLPETPDTAPQREALLRDLAEMAGLIGDLLESERLASRHAALHREPADLAPLLRDVLAELQVRHPGAAAVTVQADAALPVLELDATRVRLLLRNLLDNALRHGAGAPVPPTVRLRAVPGGVEIVVRDHGPGVPDDQLARLAEPFYRPDSARTRASGGVGLGLYLCRLVAQAHGGTFTLRNAAPGLAVTVLLPPDAGLHNS